VRTLEKMPGHTHLYRRGAVYCHRAAVHQDIVATYGKREETFSLRTRDYAEALRRVKIEAVRIDHQFDEHRLKQAREDGAYPATDFVYDYAADAYRCPGGKALRPYWRNISEGRPEFGRDGFKKYFARKQECAACALKPRCTPNQATRKIARSRLEAARQRAREIARTDSYVASSYARKKVEMLFAHLKRIIGLDRLRLRGPNGAKDEFHLAATDQNLRKLAKLRPMSA